jgi:alpha-2-macroglobulin-like protein
VKKSFFAIASILLIPTLLIAQVKEYIASKEKIYVQTSHVFFKPGETVFCKLYVVKAKDQTPSYTSNNVYAELVNPSGNIVQKKNFRVEGGYAQGSFDLDPNLVGGIYKLRAYTNWMKNEKETGYFIKELTVQKVISPRILMKLDFPGRGYSAGSVVNADFSMRDLSDKAIRNYQARFDVSIAGSIVHSGNFKTNNEGKAKLSFSLPAELKSSDGILNIIVEYDSYKEGISRSIPIVLNNIDLQFMPEGGTLINGIRTNVAFKALNEHGKGADVKGIVFDNNGMQVTSFESYHLGMGKFSFTPEKGKTYTAKITSPAGILPSYKFPLATDQGIVFNVIHAGSDFFLKIVATKEKILRVKGSINSTVYYDQKLHVLAGENVILMNKKKFPAGIVIFTLYDESLPLAERLYFINEDKLLRISVTADKKKYLPREQVTLKIHTTDEKGNPVPANLSLAVMDDKLWTYADDKQDHILSWLLLSSDLKGTVEEPQFYFKKGESKAIPSLDLVMLTHGYRYFDYIDDVKRIGKLKFFPEQDKKVSGLVVNAKGKPAKAHLFLVNSSGGRPAKTYASANGSFVFSHVRPGDSYILFVQSVNKKEKLTVRFPENSAGFQVLKTAQPHVEYLQKPGRALRDIQMVPAEAQLREVVVTGFAVKKKRDEIGFAQARVVNEELQPGNDLNNALQGRMAGLIVHPGANAFAENKTVLRGLNGYVNNKNVLVVIDGIETDEITFKRLVPAEIRYLTLLKQAEATALFGQKASNGAIIIRTNKPAKKNGVFNTVRKYNYTSEIIAMDQVSYSVSKCFYAPEYLSSKTNERTDFRETIYWDPVVRTDNNGNAQVQYFNSDASTTFRVISEGITRNGKPGRTEFTYHVQNGISVDAKIPPYLTVGDRPLIPLVLKNNTREEIKIMIGVELPEGLVAGEFDSVVTIAADKTRQVLIPVDAIAAVNGKIRFSIRSNLADEVIVQPVDVAEKGFPVVQTFSGNKSAAHAVYISSFIPGSMQNELKIFKNVEGQLLDGIESMLREPCGCFEQTSCTTYPNVYVLKYLRESGRSNPEIETKALRYIENGYKRLIGFETPENGFEWFGKAPAHEALTAYGLLEFTDMQDFVKVDRQMLERTKKFLLDRRDGKGGFKMAPGGYDQFASVPGKIANIYIVYALSQAGIGKEIEQEYHTAVAKAIESNDAYQLSMMALAASNMNNKTDYEKLLNLVDRKTMSAETSVVNSREASLRVETLSLYALALMRSPGCDMGSVADIISKILSEKTYYGYGNTQATVLALKAIIEFSKFSAAVTKSPEVNFFLNQQSLAGMTVAARDFRNGENNFKVSYASGAGVPYSFQVKYNTLTPPSSIKSELKINTQLKDTVTRVGATVRMKIEVKNVKNQVQPMAIAKIGIPAGLGMQPWQLKEIMEKNQVAYYEIFDNYLVFYWMGFAANETKIINLDLKAEIPGTYKAKAGNVYLYYTPEYKDWAEGSFIKILF